MHSTALLNYSLVVKGGCRPLLFMVVKDYFTLYLAIFWTGSTSHEI